MRMDLSARLEAIVGRRPEILRMMRRGIEKEGLRVAGGARISQTDHPAALGCTLTHPWITTDYSEALLELITPVCDTVEEVMHWLDQIHRFVHVGMADDEVLWNASMPCRLAGEESIRIAEYGASNLGRLKHVYRKGLALRYGRTMQSIAGIHYNWSMQEGFWEVYAELLQETGELQDFRSRHYFGLIRNFRRWSWLLMLLFGASPALDRSFLQGPHPALRPLGRETLQAEFATSLRMGDLGYKNDAQSGLFVCFNHLHSYVRTLHAATHTPHPPYARFGTRQGDEFLQLNTNVLQIENEYYNNIRPKRVTLPGEKPLQALSRRGVEYIEVRCLDINPFLPLGIDAEQCRFMDLFLLTCLLVPSELLGDHECYAVQDNFAQVVMRGRQAGLMLDDEEQSGGTRPLRAWAEDILARMASVASCLDALEGDGVWRRQVTWALDQLHNPEQLPSTKLLAALQEGPHEYADWIEAASWRWRQQARQQTLPADALQQFERTARESWAQEADLRAADRLSFEDYLAEYLS